jgi:lysyl-tRNA synthetase class II
MSVSPCFRFLRPCLQHKSRHLTAPKKAAYLQFYRVARQFSDAAAATDLGKSHPQQGSDSKTSTLNNGKKVLHVQGGTRREDVRQRIDELKGADALRYPRVKHDERALTCATFRERYSSLEHDESRVEERVTLRGMCISASIYEQFLTYLGRIYSFRIGGSKLAFIDIVQDGYKVQGLCNLAKLEALGVADREFREFLHIARRGDIICEFLV